MVGYGVKNGESFARIKVVHVLFDHINEAIICDGNQIFLLARRFKKTRYTNWLPKRSGVHARLSFFPQQQWLGSTFCDQSLRPKITVVWEKMCRNCRLSLPNYCTLCIFAGWIRFIDPRSQNVAWKKSHPTSHPKSPFSITLAPRIV